MALYDFRCTRCGTRVEKRYPMGTAPESYIDECRSCGIETIHVREYSAPGLKRDGTYSYRDR